MTGNLPKPISLSELIGRSENGCLSGHAAIIGFMRNLSKVKAAEYMRGHSEDFDNLRSLLDISRGDMREMPLGCLAQIASINMQLRGDDRTSMVIATAFFSPLTTIANLRERYPDGAPKGTRFPPRDAAGKSLQLDQSYGWGGAPDRPVGRGRTPGGLTGRSGAPGDPGSCSGAPGDPGCRGEAPAKIRLLSLAQLLGDGSWEGAPEKAEPAALEQLLGNAGGYLSQLVRRPSCTYGNSTLYSAFSVLALPYIQAVQEELRLAGNLRSSCAPYLRGGRQDLIDLISEIAAGMAGRQSRPGRLQRSGCYSAPPTSIPPECGAGCQSGTQGALLLHDLFLEPLALIWAAEERAALVA